LARVRGWVVGASNDGDGVAVAIEEVLAATESAAMVV